MFGYNDMNTNVPNPFVTHTSFFVVLFFKIAISLPTDSKLKFIFILLYNIRLFIIIIINFVRLILVRLASVFSFLNFVGILSDTV